MSLSNDEDDEFQSADEDGFDEDLLEDMEAAKNLIKEDKPDNEPIVNKVEDKEAILEPEVKQSSAHKLERSPSLSDVEKPESKQVLGEEEDEDESEEALAERIRERNLKIARKFSAELAKSVQASAPIPVKTEPPIGFRVDDIEYPDNPDSEKKKRSQPLAPPPTPALSSSFSAEDSSSPSTQESPGTQYGWRLPIKPRSKQSPDAPPNECDINQARAALDRLSEKYTDGDKSLFQKVADDLKKVAIKPEEPPKADGASPSSSALPSLSSLGQTFGGWNWNSASRILASASEVTSQVSSVLDSVVNAPRNAAAGQQSSSESVHLSDKQQPPSVSTDKPGTAKASMSASDAMSNDAFVDLTLNAMESLGKKAFGAMTHRDETGSLQIKGLGRPWEQLLNIKKPQSERLQDDGHYQTTSSQPNIPAESTRVADSDKSDKKPSSVRRRVVNYDDSDKLD